MDRREALKKLAVGGAVAVAVPTVVSSAAFAQVNPTNPTVSVTTAASRRTATLSMTTVLGTCTNSGSPSITSSTFAITPGANISITGTTTGSLPTGTAVTRTITSTRPGPARFVNGDTFTVKVTTTFKCLVASRTCTYTYVYTYSGTSFPAATPTVSCP